MSRLYEAVITHFEDNPEPATALELKDAIGCTRQSIHRILRDLRVEGTLAYEAVLKLGANGSACREYVYRPGPSFKSRPRVASRSIVQTALESRGALLDAWWPIKAANDAQRSAA